MKHFIISDTHFFHKNVIAYEQRPFADVEEMNSILIEKWNDVVGTDDIVYHLGDFGFGNRTHLVNIVSQLNGHIVLIKGNHDRLPNSYYESAGLMVLQYGEFNTHKIGEADGVPIYATHKPPIMTHPFRSDRRVFFGHIHSKKNCIEGTGKNICVCVERINYQPLCLEDFFAAQGISNLKFFGINQNIIDEDEKL